MTIIHKYRKWRLHNLAEKEDMCVLSNEDMENLYQCTFSVLMKTDTALQKLGLLMNYVTYDKNCVFSPAEYWNSELAKGIASIETQTRKIHDILDRTYR